MDLETVKKFLRIDYDDENELLTLEMYAAEEYIKNAVGKYDDDNPLMNLLMLNIVVNMHDERALTVTSAQKENYTTRNIILQLQMDEYGGDEK